MIVRSEAPADTAAIRAVTVAAFEGHPHSDQTEHLIIERLRTAGTLTRSLVACDGDRVVGHVAFSPVSVSSGAEAWFGLSPLSVSPDRQGLGIGKELVRAGLADMSAAGAAGCVVAGDPAYYRRFGFRLDPGLKEQGIPPEYFMALVLHGPPASGIVAYQHAFYGDAA